MVTFNTSRSGKAAAVVAPDLEADASGGAGDVEAGQAGPSQQASGSQAPRKASTTKKPGGLGELSLPGERASGIAGADGDTSPPMTPAMSTPAAQTPGAHKRRASSVSNLFHRGSVGTLVVDLQVDIDMPNDTQLAITYAPIKNDDYVYRGDDFEGKAAKDDRVYMRWHFYPHAFTVETLCVVVHRIFDRSGVLTGVNAHDGRLIALISRTKELMYAHPFTCFQKSVDSLQAAFMITEQPSVKEHLPAHDRLAIMVAAFVHDVDHPGFTSEYVVAVGHALVGVYGTEGTLKKHQAAVASRLLEQADTNVLTRAGADAANAIRDRIKELIVSTDPARHDQILKDARAAIEEASDGGTRPVVIAPALGASGKKPTMMIATTEPDVPIASVENLVLAGKSLIVGQIILKAAVLAFAARPPSVNERWASRMMKESHRQGDYEKKLHGDFGASPYCDRTADRNPARALVHVCGDLAKPVYTMLADVVSETRPLLSLVEHNFERWEHVFDKEKNPAPRRASLGNTRSGAGGMGDSPARSPGILSAMRSPSKWGKNKQQTAALGEVSSAIAVPGQTQQST